MRLWISLLWRSAFFVAMVAVVAVMVFNVGRWWVEGVCILVLVALFVGFAEEERREELELAREQFEKESKGTER